MAFNLPNVQEDRNIPNQRRRDNIDNLFNSLLEDFFYPSLAGNSQQDNFLSPIMDISETESEYKIEVVIDGEIGSKIEEIMDGKLTASTINMWVKTKAKDWNRLKNAFDRINSGSVHQIDAIRTILSWEKAKINLI